jgi:hypothetical protein
VRRPIDQLLLVGMHDGPSLDVALKLFRELRNGHEEGAAIGHLLARHAIAALPEPLLLSVAAALVDRGDDDAAASTLANASSPAALVLRADLLERAGDVAGALNLVERVLLDDIDWPGARQRHARWRGALGALAESAPPADPESLPPWMETWPGVPFRLLREAGRGGAGVVYEAEDRDLGRRLAVKIYHRPDRDRAQLVHEAQVAVALEGKGIVGVFDVDPEHGWIALEWAPLGALRGPIRRGEAWVRDGAWDWAVPLARSLARVHAAGWVHHDIKPANVLFQAPDAPRLSDFGTARRQGSPCPPGSSSYVSPERLAGRPSDPADDVFGFGRVLEDALATGRGSPPNGISGLLSLAATCAGPDAARPRDGAEIVLRLAAIRPPEGRR